MLNMEGLELVLTERDSTNWSRRRSANWRGCTIIEDSVHVVQKSDGQVCLEPSSDCTGQRARVADPK